MMKKSIEKTTIDIRVSKFLKILLIISFCLLVSFENLQGQEKNWQVDVLNEPAPGYIKFSASDNGYFYLVDNYGEIQYQDTNTITRDYYSWKMMRNGNWSCYKNSKFHIFNEQLDFIDSIIVPNGYDLDFHDMESMDNGRYLILCKDTVYMDLSEIFDGGNENAAVIGVVIFEVDAQGNIYWEWNCFDYFDITDITDDIDMSLHYIDFTHANAINIAPDGNILLSCRHLDEITRINKSTGDIMWRLGGSECKNNEFEFVNDTSNGFYGFSHQHTIELLSNGNLLLYDNGNMKPNFVSRAVEYQLNISERKATKVWEFEREPPISSILAGNVQRLSNGNTLINWGERKVTEVRSDKSIVFELSYPEHISQYRTFRVLTKMNAKSANIVSNGIYDFTGGTKQNTNVKIDIEQFSGTGSLTVEKHDYAPPTASFADSNFTNILPYRWVLSKNGLTSLNGNLRIKSNGLNGIGNPNRIVIYKRDAEANGTFQKLTTNYSSATEEISADITGFGEIILCSIELSTSNLISPSNNKHGVPIKGNLIWQKISGATNYRIQIATDSLFTQLIMNSNTGNVSSFGYDSLSYNARYYWRVAGNNERDTSDWSSFFSFTTEMAPPVLTKPVNNSLSIQFNDELSWRPVQGALFYRIQIASDTLFTNILQENNSETDTNLILQLNSFDERFYWRVAAFRTTDTSRWSEIWSFRTKMAPPDLLSPSNNELNKDTSLTLDWNIISGAEYYSLQVSQDSLFNELILDISELEITEYYLDGLEFNSEYFWRVRSVRVTDSSDWSENYIFSTLLENTELLSPTDNSQDLQNELLFRWTAIQGAIHYNLQISDDSTFQNVIYDNNEISDVSKLISDLPFGTKLFWRVRGLSGKKFSKWSQIFSFSTEEVIFMEKPVLLKPENNSDNILTSGFYIWKKVSGAKSYGIVVAFDENFESVIYSNYELDSAKVLFTNYEFYKEYFWRVKAYNNNDSSEWSDVWKFKTTDNANEPDLVLNEPADGSSRNEVNGSFKWDGLDSAIAYLLQVAQDIKLTSLILNKDNITGQTYDYSNFDFNTLYFWRVGAEFYNQSIKWSETRWFLTELESPKLLLPENNSINIQPVGKLQWTEVSGASRYELLISDDSFFYNIINNENIYLNEFTYDLKDSATYWWKVMALNDTNGSRWSSVSKFATSATIDVSENSNRYDLTIYPNPVNDYVTISFSTNNNTEIVIRIIDILGKEKFYKKLGYFDKGTFVYNLNLEFLPNGFYILLFEDGTNIQTMKLLKK